MVLEYDYWTGSLNQVLETLTRSIGQYIRHYRKVKIGITSNPAKRAYQHNRSKMKWDFMVVKYETSSTNFIKQLERILIDHNWEYIQNEIGGGGGSLGPGKKYLYVLLKK